MQPNYPQGMYQQPMANNPQPMYQQPNPQPMYQQPMSNMGMYQQPLANNPQPMNEQPENNNDAIEDKEQGHSLWFTIIAFVVPILLGGIGIYCIVAGKWINDSTSLLYAGIALVVLAMAATIGFVVYFKGWLAKSLK